MGKKSLRGWRYGVAAVSCGALLAPALFMLDNGAVVRGAERTVLTTLRSHDRMGSANSVYERARGNYQAEHQLAAYHGSPTTANTSTAQRGS